MPEDHVPHKVVLFPDYQLARVGIPDWHPLAGNHVAGMTGRVRQRLGDRDRAVGTAAEHRGGEVEVAGHRAQFHFRAQPLVLGVAADNHLVEQQQAAVPPFVRLTPAALPKNHENYLFVILQ